MSPSSCAPTEPSPPRSRSWTCSSKGEPPPASWPCDLGAPLHLAEAPFAPVKAGLPRGPAARGWQDIGYGCILPYSDQDGGPQDQLRNAISSILGTWLDQHSEAFCQPPDFPCLKQPVAYMQLNMPGSDLEHRAQLLLAQLEHADLTETEPEGTIWKAGMSISSVASPLSQRLMMAPAPAPGPSEDLDQPQKHQQN
ncbi:uncharacterized protein LOC105068620 [Camelus bactrianus]|uniref:Ral guanine nucleotide dissociation stimulator-like n=1 Tax=Camelus bactrianus TaxID=9837 RepID=A0A9W3HHM7_CAMBA|nr:ral guanine nucleotide dissociation stimulator-like [Camelus bactrianus]